jgi:hypothetical protein
MSYGGPPNTGEKRQIIITDKFSNRLMFSPFNFKFTDNIKPEFQSYDGFGRMDSIVTYKRTSRDASLSFKIVAETNDDAKYNFIELNKLILAMYPSYNGVIDSSPAATTPGAGTTSPSVAAATITGATATGASDYSSTYIKSAPLIRISFMNLLSSQNILAAVNNFKYDMDFENGSSTYMDENGNAYPGIITIDLSFKILHTYLPGTKNIYSGT